MAKRFTDTSKYKKPFVRGLKGAYKLLWDFLYHDCDHAGIWIVDFDIAQLYLGADMLVNKEDALTYFNSDEERIVIVDGGKKWFIPSFIAFQYGELSDNNRAHTGVINTLNKYNLLNYSKISSKPLTSPLQGDKDKDKDKDSISKGKKTENTEEEINFQNEKIFSMLIPEMMEIWKKHKPNYPIDKEKDFHSLLQMAYRIAEQNGWKRSEVVDLKKVQVIEFWEKMAIVAAADAWYSSKPLSVIISQWQGVFQKVNEIKKDSPKKMVF